jgi:rhodanese-related sulfurtransferase
MRLTIFIFFLCIVYNDAAAQKGLLPGQPQWTKEQVYSNVSAEQAKTVLYNNADVIALDVRTEGEYKSGKIDKAIHIDYNATDFKEQINKLDKKNTYLVYCRSGSRSSAAMEIMKAEGFMFLYHLEGGILSWSETK